MRVAIFDFDGTLYKKETFKILMHHLKHHSIYHTKYQSFFRWVAPRYIAYKMKLYPETRLKSQSMYQYILALADLSRSDLMIYFDEASRQMKQDFNADVVSRLEQHITDGVHVMIVSGAYTLFLQTAVNHLTYDEIIGTEIPFTGEAMDPKKPMDHINGSRKVDKIHDSLADKVIDWENSFAYADSYSDLPVLELVGNPVVVQPEKKLRTVAISKGWEII